MKDLEQAIERNIRHKRMLAQGERLIVAVSGGVDSMVLLHLLHQLAKRHKWKLTVAHFNHRLRGKSSDADEGLVRSVAKSLGLSFARTSANVRKTALQNRISVEMAARDLRHHFFATCARKYGASCVALAHHADDQLEQFFLRLFRGTGSRALSGIQWKNVSPVDPDIRLIRPLLDQPKGVLAAYAEQKRIRYREDATNRSADIQRNRIRHELLPLLLKSYQPGLPVTILRIQEIVGAESELVKELALCWLQNSRTQPGKKSDPFDKLHVAVQRRAIQLQLEQQGMYTDFELVEKLRLHPDKPVSVSSASNKSVQLFATRTKNGRVELNRNSSPLFTKKMMDLLIDGGRNCQEFGGLRLKWQIQRRKGVPKPASGPGWEWFDAEQVGKKIVLRSWRPGDRFQPIGSSKPVKLQDFFTNSKIPRERRHELVLACTVKGDIFWVEGLRISERFKLTDQTNRRLQWQWKRL